MVLAHFVDFEAGALQPFTRTRVSRDRSLELFLELIAVGEEVSQTFFEAGLFLTGALGFGLVKLEFAVGRSHALLDFGAAIFNSRNSIFGASQ